MKIFIIFIIMVIGVIFTFSNYQEEEYRKALGSIIASIALSIVSSYLYEGIKSSYLSDEKITQEISTIKKSNYNNKNVYDETDVQFDTSSTYHTNTQTQQQQESPNTPNIIQSEKEDEDNNSYLYAKPILLNSTYYGSLTDDYSSEKDWYVFTLDNSGVVTVYFNTKMQADNNAYWDINIRSGDNPDNDIWQQYIYGYTTNTESIILPLSAGTYYFEVESSSNWSTDEYSFEINYNVVENWEIENNNSFQTANRVTLNTEYFGVLQDKYSSEKDWYVFTLDNSGVVTVYFNTKMQADDSAYWDINIRPEDNPDNEIWKQYVHGYTTNTESVILPLSAGTYYFEVESSSNWSTDEYSFEINYNAVENWEVESNNSFQIANRVTLNTEYFGVLQDKYSLEKDWYVFTLDNPGTVTVQFNTKMQANNNLYWDISVRSGDNPDNDIWQKYVDGITTVTIEKLTLDAGTYYFEIESSNDWSTDTYSFVIN